MINSKSYCSKEVSRPHLYIMRHGKTEWNAMKKLQGMTDIPLSESGKEGVRKICPNISQHHCDRIVTSPLLRAHQTATIVGESLNIEIHVDSRLREIDHGKWEGKNYSWLLHQNYLGYAKFMTNPASLSIPGGSETIYEAQTRIVECIMEIEREFGAENVLIITHMGIRSLLLLKVMNKPFDYFSDFFLPSTLPMEISLPAPMQKHSLIN